MYSVLGEVDATHAQLKEAGQAFFCALYGQPQGTSMSEARYNMYTRKHGKPLKVMSLPPTDKNLLLHILRAHLQTILAKAADQVAPPELDITKYGWDIKDEIPVPSISDQPPGPKNLMDVVRCGCKATLKTCSTERCNCHQNKISCTVYCSCACSDICFNPFKVEHKEENETEAGMIESDVEGDEVGENSDIDTDDEWE